MIAWGHVDWQHTKRYLPRVPDQISTLDCHVYLLCLCLKNSNTHLTDTTTLLYKFCPCRPKKRESGFLDLIGIRDLLFII